MTLEANSEGGRNQRLSRYGKLMKSVVKTQWKSDDHGRSTNFDLIQLFDQVVDGKGAKESSFSQGFSVQFNYAYVDGSSRIISFFPNRFAVFIKRYGEISGNRYVLAIYMKVDEK